MYLWADENVSMIKYEGKSSTFNYVKLHKETMKMLKIVVHYSELYRNVNKWNISDISMLMIGNNEEKQHMNEEA